jgi:sialic acid synthase SpsE
MGELANAYAGIAVAAEAGCNAWKAQFWSNPARMRARRHMPHDAQNYTTGSIASHWLALLKRECVDHNIAFACSVFLPEDVAVLDPYVDVWKISSFEALDDELCQAVADVRGERPWFISTGMQDERDVPASRWPAIRLHCVSAYPAPLEEANLGAIEPHEGYSDHTRCIYTGGLAVAAGADYLEVHYRLQQTPTTCPDYPVALSPTQLAQYVDFARTAALARGSGDKVPQDCERDNMRYRVIS